MRRTYWMSVEQICTIIVALMLASCVRVNAQFGVEQPMFAMQSTEAPFTPKSVSSLGFWWVGSDIPGNSTGTIVSNWLDRIQSAPLTNIVASSPVATNGIVYSKAGKVLYYSPTNYVVTTTNHSLLAIFQVSSHQNTILFAGYGNNYGWRPQGDGKLYYYDGGFNQISTTPTSWSDMLFSGTTTNYTFYTNNIQASTGTGGWSGIRFWSVLEDAAGNNQQLREIMIFTNAVLSSVQRSNIHWYCTNTYTYTP